MSRDAFERDLRTLLASLAPDELPASLRAPVAALPARPPRASGRLWKALLPAHEGWFDRLGSAALGAVALALIVVLGSIVMLYAGRAPLAPGSGGDERALSWRTQSVSLEADALVIEAGGRTFSAPGRVSLVSDPGGPTYRTLEATWRDDGIEMRLNLYFGADEDHWWVNEIRTYDGRPRGDWITYRGVFFKTARGDSFEGNVHLASGPGRLRIERLRLSAFGSGTAPRPIPECRAVGPVPKNALEPVISQLDPDLTEFGIASGMEAREAHARLAAQGICHEFRLEFPALNVGQVWCLPPPGKVREALFGSRGEIILFVEDATRRTNDPNMPQTVGC